jgi:TRAP-type mannitol/chloroaromatic compound transport system permease small subunit
MNLFYDSITKKPKIWIYVVFFLVPFIIIGLFLAFATTRQDQSTIQDKDSVKDDIFAELERDPNPIGNTL